MFRNFKKVYWLSKEWQISQQLTAHFFFLLKCLHEGHVENTMWRDEMDRRQIKKVFNGVKCFAVVVVGMDFGEMYDTSNGRVLWAKFRLDKSKDKHADS